VVTSSAADNGDVTTTSYDTAGNPDTVIARTAWRPRLATTTRHSTGLSLPECSKAVLASSPCSASFGPSVAAPGG
jgi:hypothetical protein